MDTIISLLNTGIIPIGENRYITLFAILLLLIFFLLVFLVLKFASNKVKSGRAEKQQDVYEQYCHITNWQREAVPVLLEKHDVQRKNDYILQYMNENDTWYSDEIMDYDFEILKRFSKQIFDEVIANVMQSSYCFMLLHLIDTLNGGIDVNEKEELLPWISDKVASGSIENRLKNVFSSCLLYIKNNNLVAPLLINDAAQDIIDHAEWDYSEDTYKILILAHIHYIKDKFISKDLSDVGLSYIRSLASLFAKNDYLEAVESLED